MFDNVCRIPGTEIVCKSDEDLVSGKCLVKCDDGKVRGLFDNVCKTPVDFNGVECKSDEELYLGKCLVKCADNKVRGILNTECKTPVGTDGIAKKL